MKNQTTLKLCEGAAMIALAFGLSFIAIIKMPFGGSVTACSMLPIALFAYRRGWRWGLGCGFVFSVLQLLQGMSSLQYATSAGALIAILLLDYIVPFSVLGLAGIFRGKIKGQAAALVCGTTMVCLIRYICHVISGCTVWAGVSVPTGDGLVYSLVYNAAYMVPEAFITIVAAWYVARLVNFESERLSANKPEALGYGTMACRSVGLLFLLVGIVFDALYMFQSAQTEEGFDITQIQNMNFSLFGAVLISGVVICGILFTVAHFTKTKKN